MSNEEVIVETARRGRPRDGAKDEAILHAAAALFLDRGFEASVDAVAAQAGVSKATIYARYDDKDALFCAVLAWKCGSVVPPGSFVHDPQVPVRDTLITIAKRFLDLVLGDDAMRMHRLIVADPSRAARMAELFFATAVTPLKDRFAAWLAGESDAGRLRVADPQGSAWRYLGAVKGEAHMRASLGLRPVEPDRLARHIEACADEFLRAHG
jgi:TetR/AcrR family transcriptional repressor of mexJK operon